MGWLYYWCSGVGAVADVVVAWNSRRNATDADDAALFVSAAGEEGVWFEYVTCIE